jgi:hypothetical protein
MPVAATIIISIRCRLMDFFLGNEIQKIEKYYILMNIYLIFLKVHIFVDTSPHLEEAQKLFINT